MPLDGKKIYNVKNWLIPFSALFIILAYLSFETLLPLLQPVSWAVILAFLSYPIYSYINNRLLNGKCPSFCALIMTMFIMFVIIAPAIIVGLLMASEAVDLYTKYYFLLTAENFPIDDIISPEFSNSITSFLEKFPIIKDISVYFKFQETLQDIMKNISFYCFQMARGFLGNTLGLIYSLLIIFISYFFLVRDGHIILEYIKDIVPLAEEEQLKFMNRGKDTLRGVVYGVTLTAVVQGILGAIGWWMVELPAPLIFGALMAFMAFIPLVGTPSVWLPGTVYLLIIKEYQSALILFLWGIFVVSMIDNFMRPKFTSDKAKISTFLVFIGAFGGIMAWGFLGLFIGPLILSLSVYFLDSYREIWKLSLKSELGNGRKGLS